MTCMDLYGVWRVNFGIPHGVAFDYKGYLRVYSMGLSSSERYGMSSIDAAHEPVALIERAVLGSPWTSSSSKESIFWRLSIAFD